MNENDILNDRERWKRYSDLCHRILNRTATETEHAEFEAMVLSSDALKRDFVELLHQESMLQLRAGIGMEPRGGVEPRVLHDIPVKRSKAFLPMKRRFSMVALAASALLILSLGAALWSVRDRPVLTIASAKDCQWGTSTLATIPGRPLGPGRLVLNSGIAEVKLALVDLTIEGPTDIEIFSGERCFVRAGKVFANVHPGGEGFVIETPTSILTDRGTVFAVNVAPWGDSELTVIKGTVDAKHLRTGEIVSVDTFNRLQMTDSATKASSLNSESTSTPFDNQVPPSTYHQIQISTANGNGKDAYVIGGKERLHTNSAGYLLVKEPLNRQWGPQWRRRAYIHFDLTSFPKDKLREAKLQLQGAATNIGYLSLTPDTFFSVYGLTDEAKENWSEDTLDWTNSPGFQQDHLTLDPEKTVMLGKFLVPNSQTTDSFSIEGEALLKFLQSDTNGGATMLIVAETAADGESHVQGFASRRHPHLTPPTLRLGITAR